MRRKPSEGSVETGHVQGVGRVFVSVGLVRSAYVSEAAGMDWRVVVAVPAHDLLEEVERGRDVAIGVAAGAVALACAGAVLLVRALLRPMRLLADHMLEAATLRGREGPVPSAGVLEEAHMMATAFGQLAEQLARARAFLPPSLLAALDQNSDESEGGFDMLTPRGHRRSLPFAGEGSTPRGAVMNERSTPRGGRRHSLPEVEQQATPAVPSAARLMGDSASKDDAQRTVSATMASTRSSEKANERTAAVLRATSAQCRNVTVVYLNLRGFQRAVDAVPALLGRPYGVLVAAVAEAGTRHGGIIDSFSGDRFTVAFNAVRPCGAHVFGGVAAACELVAQTAVPATCGVAQGLALVGNLGSATVRRFTMVGDVVPQAAALERLCKAVPGARVLVPRPVASEVAHAAEVIFVDVAVLPGAQAARRIAIANVGRITASGAGDEWMYEVMATSLGAGAKYNDVFTAAVDGDPDPARELLASFGPLDEVTPLQQHSRTALRGVAANRTYLMPILDGGYYAACVLGGGTDSLPAGGAPSGWLRRPAELSDDRDDEGTSDHKEPS